MMNISLLYNVFLGETSPLIAARIDSPVNEMGARRMENMIPMLTGGMRKRPGTWFDGTTEENKEARLIEWLVSDGNCILLEMTAGKIRAWCDQGNNTYQVIQTINSPYTAAQIFRLHYASSADDLWIVHPEQRPIKLSWNGSAAEIPIDMDFPRFTNGDGEKDFITENNCPGAVAFDAGRLVLAGSNNEPNRIYMSRSPDSQTGNNRHTDFTMEDKYTTIRETSRIVLDENGKPVYEDVLDENDNPVYGPEKIAFEMLDNQLIFDNKVYSPIEKTFLSTNVQFSSYRIDIFNGNKILQVGSIYCHIYSKNVSIVASGTGIIGEAIYNLSPYCDTRSTEGVWYWKGEPLTQPKYETETEVIENIVITASHAIVIEENDMHGSRLQWIAGNRHLLAATERATWNDTGEVPTPATFDMNIIEYAGSSDLQARGTKEIMVYAGRDGKSLRALVWNQNSQGSGYIDMDISEQAAHLLGAGIKDFAVADYPYPMLWIVTKAGELVSCTINIRAGIIAYSKHPTDGIVEAVAVAPQRTGDVIFLSVNRNENRNIEHIILEDLVNSDFTDSHYIDAGEKKEFDTPTKTITGLERLAGKTILAFADGAMEPPVVVNNNGIAEFQTAISKIHFGLPYKAAFIPNTRQIPANGTSVGKKRRVEKVTLQLYKSLGGKAGTDEDKTTAIITKRFGKYELGSAPEPFTGEYDITVSGNIDTEGELVITHEEPTPFTLLALVERVAILEA